MSIDTKKLSEDIRGFGGRFFLDADGDLAYQAEDCIKGACDCSEGECIADVAHMQYGEEIAAPIVRMLNAVRPLLDEIDRLGGLVDILERRDDERERGR